mmetsp:Transcript_19856/g.50040  ORF Transcript_19856/g.50040 Transcript_19856/m.50040 type:complete len:143 (+) Transcript_19856:415-843(+)
MMLKSSEATTSSLSRGLQRKTSASAGPHDSPGTTTGRGNGAAAAAPYYPSRGSSSLEDVMANFAGELLREFPSGVGKHDEKAQKQAYDFSMNYLLQEALGFGGCSRCSSGRSWPWEWDHMQMHLHARNVDEAEPSWRQCWRG